MRKLLNKILKRRKDDRMPLMIIDCKKHKSGTMEYGIITHPDIQHDEVVRGLQRLLVAHIEDNYDAEQLISF